tara:strand:- start:425 stop:658 length:234 start_codon:yes stop_codon:yes gene_type:complete
MTLTSKFKKDISTLRAAANKEIYLDVKNPKLYKKVSRYYVSEGLVQLSGEDPDADYNSIMECVAEDLGMECNEKVYT